MTTGERAQHRKVESKSEQRWFERWQGIVGAALGAIATVAAALLPFLLATHSSPPAPAATLMCLDAGVPPHDSGNEVTVRWCVDNSDQKWAVSADGQIRLKSPSGNTTRMCLAADGPPDSQHRPTITIRECRLGSRTQEWVVRSSTQEGVVNSQIMLKYPVGNAEQMCLDAGLTPRRYNQVIIFKCRIGNSAQDWVMASGQIKIRDI